MNGLKAMVMRICVMIGSRMTYRLQMCMERQRRRRRRRRTTTQQRNEWDQERPPITLNNHRKPIEEAGMSQSRRYTWRAQPQRHALKHLINMFFLKTYTVCYTIWSEIAIRKCSTAPTSRDVDCSTLQTSRANKTYRNKSQSMHLFNPTHPLVHSFIRIMQEHCHLSQSSTMHCMAHWALAKACDEKWQDETAWCWK